MTIAHEIALREARRLSDKHGCAQYVFRRGDDYRIVDTFPDNGFKVLKAFGIEHVKTIATNGWKPGDPEGDWW